MLRGVVLCLLLSSASALLSAGPPRGRGGRAAASRPLRGSSSSSSSDDAPLLSIPIPGSARARLEVPGWATQRRLFREVLDEAQRVSPEAALRRSVGAGGAVAATLAAIAADPSAASAPRAARELCEALGATFVKLGQLVASSPTLFPEAWVTEFEKTLDDAPPVAFAEVEKIVVASLGGRSLASAYASFDPTPLATASVAQVHAATLKTGERVVVKVLKPGVADTLAADLALLTSTAKILEAIAPETKRVSLADVAEQLRDSTLQELDLREEARRLRSFRGFLERSGLAPNVTCPLPIEALSGERVLTMTRLDGKRLVDATAGAAAADAVATVVRAWALSVVSHDFFHADLHGGNVLLLPNGTVGLIDFGIVGTLPPAVYGAVVDMAEAYNAAPRDYLGVATALRAMGIVDDAPDAPGAFDARAFADDLRRALEGLESGNAAGAVADVIGVSERNNLVLPREFGLLTKQVVYLNRYTSSLAPDVNLFAGDLLAANAAALDPRTANAAAAPPAGAPEARADDAAAPPAGAPVAAPSDGAREGSAPAARPVRRAWSGGMYPRSK